MFEWVWFGNSLGVVGQEEKDVNNLQPFIFLLELLSL